MSDPRDQEDLEEVQGSEENEEEDEYEDVDEVPDSEKTPVTIVTGFLGSGKTTLVNYILREQREWKIAVIENEFGQVPIDDDLVGENLAAAEDIITMDNGCVCCSVRGDLVRALGSLVARRAEFDAIILETTGLADPAPIIFTFNSNIMIADNYRIDSVLCLVDAKHVNIHLDEKKPDGNVNEAEHQIAFSDRILLNKVDLVSAEELQEVEDRIKSINSFADVIRTQGSRAPLDRILGLASFSLQQTLEVDPDLFKEDEGESHDHDHDHDCKGCNDHSHAHEHEHEHEHEHNHDCKECEHEHEHEHEHDHDCKECEDHSHDHAHTGKHTLTDSSAALPVKKKRHNLSLITSVGFSTSSPLHIQVFNMFMSMVLSEKAKDIYRSKGVLLFEGHPDQKFVFQGVHEQINFGPSEVGWREDQPRMSKLVFIGKELNIEQLQAGLRACTVDPETAVIHVHHRE